MRSRQVIDRSKLKSARHQVSAFSPAAARGAAMVPSSLARHQPADSRSNYNFTPDSARPQRTAGIDTQRAVSRETSIALENQARDVAHQVGRISHGVDSHLAGGHTERVAEALATSGEPLRSDVIAHLQLGHNFAEVRVHADSVANRAVRDLSADAFTYGQHVFVSQNMYPPASASHAAMLVHELTHTVQQRGAIFPFVQLQATHEGLQPTQPLQYTTGQTMTSLAPPPGLVSLKSAGSIASTVAGWFRDVTNAIKLKKALDELQPRIAAMMPAKGGVLVGLVYQEDPLVASFSTRLFMYAYVMAAGATPQEAYAKHKQLTAGGTISEAPFKGWQKVEQPFWIASQ